MFRTTYAVIVTFNRPNILKGCISALLVQKEHGLKGIHVVVNSDDEETIRVIASFNEGDFISFERHGNIGPAGGFHEGLKKFLEGPYEFVWLMDDDVIVDRKCLYELGLSMTKFNYIFPTVIKENGEKVESFGWWGVVLSRNLVERAGLPIKEFFYWAEDTEYLQNRIMRKLGAKPYRCPKAVVKHLHQRGSKRPSWYYYYTTRNTLYYRSYLAGYTWYRFKRTLYLLPHSFFMIFFKEDNKIRKIRLMFYGLYHGLVGKIGKIIDPKLNE